MQQELWRPSRWIMRVIEWDDPRARYPNIWHEGMPSQILANSRVARRLGLGDLLAIYYPSSQRHPERGERFLGLSRVTGLRDAKQSGFAWIDLDTAHRFEPPLSVGRQPRRVFLCCNPGWPELEVSLFQSVFDAALAAGWKPTEEESEPLPAQHAVGAPPIPEIAAPAPLPGVSAAPEISAVESAAPGVEPTSTEPGGEESTATEAEPAGPVRLFAGVDYSGDMRDPRQATWLALLELRGERLHVSRLEATGRSGLQGYLRDPDRHLMQAEAIGLDFPFGLPVPFAESLMEGGFPDEGWWALAKRLERLTRPDYLIKLQDFRDERGELKRWTDERANAFSPLHRVNPDLGPMTFHGIRMIAEDRSRYVVRPFESAQGQLLLEVYPGGVVKQLDLPRGTGNDQERRRVIIEALAKLPSNPVIIDQPHLRSCLARRDALDAVIAARCAAVAVLTGEASKTLDQLAPEETARVRYEGWIYGLA